MLRREFIKLCGSIFISFPGFSKYELNKDAEVWFAHTIFRHPEKKEAIKFMNVVAASPTWSKEKNRLPIYCRTFNGEIATPEEEMHYSHQEADTESYVVEMTVVKSPNWPDSYSVMFIGYAKLNALPLSEDIRLRCDGLYPFFAENGPNPFKIVADNRDFTSPPVIIAGSYKFLQERINCK